MGDKDEILRAIEGLRHDVARVDARTADLGVRISALENGPPRPRAQSFTNELLTEVKSVSAVAASIPPMAEETSRQTTTLGTILSHQRLFAYAAIIGALATLYSAIFHK